MPPLTRITWPVMKAAAGETSQRATAATSSGVPHRPKGVSRCTRSCQRSEALAPQAVRIQPGARQLTRTSGARVKARLLLNAMTAVVFNAPMVAYLFFWMAGSVTTVARRAETAGP